nr:(2Fe-2S)-binding protein [Pseudolabrys sp. FHR47]
MIICSCNVLSDHDVRAALVGLPAKPQSPTDVHVCLGCQVKCGRCVNSIRQILTDAVDSCVGRYANGMPAPTPAIPASAEIFV